MKDRQAGMDAIHSGDRVLEGVSRPKVPPIFASSVFSFDSLSDLDSVFDQKKPGYIYARMGHPNASLLEETISALEGTDAALVFSSGMAAIATAFLAALKPGDQVIADRVLYGGSFSFIDGFLRDWGVSVELVDTLDHDQVREALCPKTKVIYLETISNPLMGVADLPALAEIAASAGAMLFVDNTFASPALCRPASMGADVVIHSLTKYINGHSDVTGGALAGSEEFVAGASRLRSMMGGSMSPFDAWLVQRGVRTLHLRMAAHSANALQIARTFERHPRVERVEYPGLERHPSYGTARKVLEGGFGGMLSFEIRGGERAAARFVDGLRLVELVPSLASISTTISHPAKTSHRSLSEDQRRESGISDGLIRLSAGIEPVEAVLEDLLQALDWIGGE
ncbi:MAG TPA: aminotransferase class I/II-fold pyridoxal phosphate-dependent enzyme [Thermovirgaceae bacterium]|jgi:cystathionine beta-lyase/cystathionine gamma-synthase|nr:aminotransferase class I/II-fold pyridoxal phosphate-dependent enzyme [Synergistales bacterium]MDI9392161.1 aminotransferase class I/II-fold pyridoxal phosphate-dependent enzyme [Synergistota bacterium]HRW87699.1 aminotransferase class I/II-fold pyridoxal phosphate-dependent enzyme [Thermovirgaceae bacterium]MDD5514133.1 aminotransferase class I/II-fold pyridoxal phosphate-dependent enzyme [Synergistales bacterium]HPE91459.1 aminotransferase class I/II-fold pyridoxal phosphate-dependent enzy